MFTVGFKIVFHKIFEENWKKTFFLKIVFPLIDILNNIRNSLLSD